MRLVEQHTITKKNKFYGEIDRLSFLSKNLYNSTLYAVRQHYFNNKTYLPYARVQNMFQSDKQQDYVALPAKVAQWTMKMVDQNFRSFFGALKAYQADKSKFDGPPRIPNYLDSKKGRCILTYTNQAVSKRILDKCGMIRLSGTDIDIPTNIQYNQLNQVRVIHKPQCYVVEIVYEIPDAKRMGDNGKYAAIDLGVNNLATVTSNDMGFEPFAIDGREVKSINRFYNKELSKMKSILDTRNKGKKSSNGTKRLTHKRNNKIKDYMHKASRMIVNHLVSKGINTLIVGHNNGWKQDINIGNANNQSFVDIPFNMLIWMLRYKCAMEGINVVVCEESYTSKCSFIDGEAVHKHAKYVGKRIHRGLFKTKGGLLVNADVNGSYNILIKSKPKAFDANGVEGVLVHPWIIKIRN